MKLLAGSLTNNQDEFSMSFLLEYTLKIQLCKTARGEGSRFGVYSWLVTFLSLAVDFCCCLFKDRELTVH